jgi:hypothetical protein
MNCPNCGNTLPDNAAFCNLCGTSTHKFSPPEGFIRDAASGFYYRLEYDGAGKNIGATWFNAITGTYKQERIEPKPEPTPEPIRREQVPVAAVAPVQERKPAPPPPPPPPPVHTPPEGFTLDPNSGFYYLYTKSQNPQTGRNEQWITWFNPQTGGYQQVMNG